MKVLVIVLTVVSGLLLLSTLICGLWISSQGTKIVDLASSIGFHKSLAIWTVVITLGTLVLALIRK